MGSVRQGEWVLKDREVWVLDDRGCGFCMTGGVGSNGCGVMKRGVTTCNILYAFFHR